MQVVYGHYPKPITSFTPPAYDPERADEMLTMAKNAYEIKNYRRALYLLKRLVADFPDNEGARELYDRIVYGQIYPEMMIVEVTNFCKMACPGCFVQKKRGFMEYDQFTSIIDESAPYLRTLRLYNHGDSFYHPDIYRMVDYMKGLQHMEVYLSTHGSFEDFDAEALVKSGTRLFLDFSLDGASQESLKEYRKNGNFDLIMENMRKLMYYRKKYNSRWPAVEWKYIVMKPNEHEMNDAIKMAEELEIDRLLFSPFSIGWFKVDRVDQEGLRKYMTDMVSTDRRYLFNDWDSLWNEGFTGYAGERFTHCWGVGRSKSIIAWNGDVSPCSCSKPPHDNVVGNVFEAGSFKKVWDSDKYREFRKQAVLDCTKLKPCDNCHLVS